MRRYPLALQRYNPRKYHPMPTIDTIAIPSGMQWHISQSCLSDVIALWCSGVSIRA
jgi:hypothetical protein